MKTAVVSGSFDPITKGHIYVIAQALKLADEVLVLIAHNPDKKYLFERNERKIMVTESLIESFGKGTAHNRCRVGFLPINSFTAQVALDQGCSVIVRGLRNVVDFEYEHSQQIINSHIAPGVTTLFVMPPTNLIAVSSSAIKSMVGVDGWEVVVAEYVPTFVLEQLKMKAAS